MQESFVFIELNSEIFKKENNSLFTVNSLAFIIANPFVSCFDALEFHVSSLFKENTVQQLSYM